MKKVVIIFAVIVVGLVAVGLLLTNNTSPSDQATIADNNRNSHVNQALEPLPPEPWTMLVAGDIMLDRNVRATIAKNGNYWPFEKIRASLTGDIVLANLEGPFTNSTNYAVSGGSLIFTFSPEMAPVLKDVGFTHLSLANNHTLNHGQAGLDNTRRVLTDAQLKYFGDPNNVRGFGLEDWQEPDHLAFIGYHGLAEGFDNIVADIRDAKANGLYTIVIPHWGAEYQLGIQPRLQTLAHQLIDAGADLVIGGHPHVVEPLEIYNGKLIFYSLGNFLFDQYFSEDTLEGLMARLTFNPSTVNIQLIPIRTTDRQVQLLTDERGTALLARLAENSDVPEDIVAGIQTGRFEIAR